MPHTLPAETLEPSPTFRLDFIVNVVCVFAGGGGHVCVVVRFDPEVQGQS